MDSDVLNGLQMGIGQVSMRAPDWVLICLVQMNWIREVVESISLDTDMVKPLLGCVIESWRD
ncbi:MAG: hypothetical protein B6D79_10120 [gamma proteobacterium symbiont of Ctena orbiculata]|nr:MAG: hypothetical protein B6D79_10120 [gamma proteobacterium symbiont of Ctena orbiculata]